MDDQENLISIRDTFNTNYSGVKGEIQVDLAKLRRAIKNKKGSIPLRVELEVFNDGQEWIDIQDGKLVECDGKLCLILDINSHEY